MAVAAADPVEAMVGRLFMESLGAMHQSTVYIGVKFGLFSALAEPGQLTAAELATRCGLDEWYVREWLQAETTAGLVRADSDDLRTARFCLAEGVHETLVDETNPAFIGGLAYAAGAVANAMPALLEAYRTGAGVPMSAYGPEVVSAQAMINRPVFVNSLVAEFLPGIPDVLARLQDTDKPALIADVGCGVGWASIELAKAFPHIRIDAYDSDEPSIIRARANAAEAGVADRVTFHLVDAKSGLGDKRYDVIFFFECVHDMAHPDRALSSARQALADGGTVIVMDERVEDTPPEPGDPTQTFFATVSVLWCLPQGRVEADSEAPGTVMKPSTLRGIARRAGWSDIEILDVEHPFFRFYRMR